MTNLGAMLLLTLAAAAPAEEALQRGQKAWREGDFSKAGAELRRASELDPQLPKAHRLLAKLLATEGELAEAMEHCKAYLALAPKGTDAPQVRDLLASLEREAALGMSSVGIKALRFEALLEELESAVKARNVARVRRLYGLTRSLQPKRWELGAMVGTLYLEEGLFPEAEAALRASMASAPPEKREALAEALALCERENEYRQNLANGLKAFAASDFARAGNLLEVAILLRPEAPDGVDEALTSLISSGDWKRAAALARAHVSVAAPERLGVSDLLFKKIEQMATLQEQAENTRAPADEGPQIVDLADDRKALGRDLAQATREAERLEQEAIVRVQRLMSEIQRLKDRAEALRDEISGLPDQISSVEQQANEMEALARQVASGTTKNNLVGSVLFGTGTMTGAIALKSEAEKLRRRLSEASSELNFIQNQIATKQAELGSN